MKYKSKHHVFSSIREAMPFGLVGFVACLQHMGTGLAKFLQICRDNSYNLKLLENLSEIHKANIEF